MAKYTIFSNIISGSSANIASITGSLFGTASFANNSTSASFALTASYWTGSVSNAISASYATTSSYTLNVDGGFY